VIIAGKKKENHKADASNINQISDKKKLIGE
jgi:hypothetical protein